MHVPHSCNIVYNYLLFHEHTCVWCKARVNRAAAAYFWSSPTSPIFCCWWTVNMLSCTYTVRRSSYKPAKLSKEKQQAAAMQHVRPRKKNAWEPCKPKRTAFSRCGHGMALWAHLLSLAMHMCYIVTDACSLYAEAIIW